MMGGMRNDDILRFVTSVVGGPSRNEEEKHSDD